MPGERWTVVTNKALRLIGRPQGATVSELMDELSISRRAAYRLLATLQAIGAPIYEERDGRTVRRKLDASYRKRWVDALPPLSLTLDEVVALYLLKGSEAMFRGTDVERSIASAFRKIDALLPTRPTQSLDPIRTLFVASSRFSKDYSGKDREIEALSDAILNKRRCRVRYHAFSDDKVKEYEIDPLHFFEREGGLYVFVRVPKHGGIRTLAVERFKEIAPTGETFDYPADFDPEEYLSNAFNMVNDDPITVRIWFAPEEARYIKERRRSLTPLVI